MRAWRAHWSRSRVAAWRSHWSRSGVVHGIATWWSHGSWVAAWRSHGSCAWVVHAGVTAWGSHWSRLHLLAACWSVGPWLVSTKIQRIGPSSMNSFKINQDTLWIFTKLAVSIFAKNGCKDQHDLMGDSCILTINQILSITGTKLCAQDDIWSINRTSK